MQENWWHPGVWETSCFLIIIIIIIIVMISIIIIIVIIIIIIFVVVIVIIIIIIILQENWWHPGVGETSCFLSSSGSSQLVYFHIPVSRSARIFELNKFKGPSYCCRIYQDLLRKNIRSDHVQCSKDIL